MIVPFILENLVMSFYHTLAMEEPAVMDGVMDDVPTLKYQPETWGQEVSPPADNFLKNFSEMEMDFRKERDPDAFVFRVHSRGKIVPIDEALKGSMEENY